MQATEEKPIGYAEAYDAVCKRLLSQKIFLAWIMRECLDEYHDCTVEDIVSRYIEGTPKVGQDDVHQDELSSERIVGRSNEDSSVNEHTVRYDICFSAIAPSDGSPIELIINVEAQNRYDPGYPLIKRAIYYGSRMISRQYGTVFDKSHYEKIKKVYSIWICLNTPNDRCGSIVKYEITERWMKGGYCENRRYYDLMTVVMVHLNGDIVKDDRSVTNLLKILLKSTVSEQEKRQLLRDDFGIEISNEIGEEIHSMCNLSQGIHEEGYMIGMTEGKYDSMINLMDSLQIGFTDTLKLLKIPRDEWAIYEALYQKNRS